MTTAAAAELVDRHPGVTDYDLKTMVKGHVGLSASWGYSVVLLQNDGYRRERESVSGAVGWWPSAARCAELARSATGDRREKLLRGMLL